ncbi:MAG: DUF2933 domain-containing protein [Patescibacteria group bacterium]
MKILLFALLIACPVMHLFMMMKHRKHSDEEHEITDEENKNKNSKDDKTHSGHGCCH